jgi:uncharacterized protein YlaI
MDINMQLWWECERKVSYSSRERALRQVAAAKRRGYTLHEYLCPNCHTWHIGHRSRNNMESLQTAPNNRMQK